MEPQVNDTAPHMIRSQLRLSNSVVSDFSWYPNLAAWFLLSFRNSLKLRYLTLFVLPAFRRQTYILTFRSRRVNPSASTFFRFPSESVWASAVRRISKIPLFRDCLSAKGWRSYVGRASNASPNFMKFPSCRPTAATETASALNTAKAPPGSGLSSGFAICITPVEPTREPRQPYPAGASNKTC